LILSFSINVQIPAHQISPKIASMKKKLFIIGGALVVTGAAAAGTFHAYRDQAVPAVGVAINYFRGIDTLATNEPGHVLDEVMRPSPTPATDFPRHE
jgi:hypothetical protein